MRLLQTTLAIVLITHTLVAQDQVDHEKPSSVTSDQSEDIVAQTPDQGRVILFFGGKQKANGRLLSTSDDEIKIRTADDEIETYRPSDVLEMVRLVEPVEGQRGWVNLRSGRSHYGVIINDDYHRVVIAVEGIEVSWLREHVHFVELEPTFEEQFELYKQNIGDGNWARHLLVVRWLLNEDRPDLALEELQAIEKFHDTPEVQNLTRIARARVDLAQGKPKRMIDESETVTEPEAVAEPEKPLPLLTDQEINRIRVYEIDFDNPPSVTIDDAIIHALLDSYRDHPLMPASVEQRNRLFDSDPIEVARFMRRLDASDLLDGIQVNDDPLTMRLFRERIHDTFLTRSCGTAVCHGGPGVGDFRLVRPKNDTDVTSRYTNYIILRQAGQDTQWPVLNFRSPEKSLLLQYALPRNKAQKPHPAVRGWTPSLNPSNPRSYDPVHDWIKAMGNGPWTDYPINYPPNAPQNPEPSPGTLPE